MLNTDGLNDVMFQEVRCWNMNKTKIRATEQPIAVDIEGLSAMLSCGRATARKIGEQAGAKIVIGRRVLYSCLLYTSDAADE